MEARDGQKPEVAPPSRWTETAATAPLDDDSDVEMVDKENPGG